MRFFALLLLCFPTLGLAQVEIEKPWTRATPPGAKMAAGYMTIRNRSASPDRLRNITSPAAARVETHVTIKDGDIVRMREVKSFDVPANGVLELKPGGAHLMFVDIKRPFKDGETIPVTLRFDKAGEVKVDFLVGRPDTSGGHKH
jgi:copper(I)-binding protein